MEVHEMAINEQEKYQEELKTAEGLYGNVNRRLQKAIANKNLGEMSVIYTLLEVASKKMKSARSDLIKIQKELKELEGNHKKIMNDY